MKKRVISNLILVFILLGIGMSVSNRGAKKAETASMTETVPTVMTTVTPTSAPTLTPTPTPVELMVYSQLSSYWGEQLGWFADIMLEKFNVTLYFVPTFSEELRNSGCAGDIIIFGNAGELYQTAVKSGHLLDWEENNLLAEKGAYIQQYMSKALEHNRTLTPDKGKIYGLGSRIALTTESVDTLVYTWDIRWDLYKRLGYPRLKNLEDLIVVFEQMKQLCPIDDAGEETYAMSLWSEWDENLVLHVKAMASAYYGYDEFYLGLYDTEQGTFHGALEEDGPYLEMVRFFNTLYRKGLLDPESRTQGYTETLAKLNQGGTFFSVYQYAGSLAYDTELHKAENKYMASLVPEEARPLAYGLSVTGGNRIWSIGAETEHPELCMEILNWLCTPEGMMVCQYGPQGVIWDYDAEGNTYFTEFGQLCRAERTTVVPGKNGEISYGDGFPQFNNVTWDINSENPDSNGEKYNCQSWKCNIPEASCEVEQDWREYTGAAEYRQYLENQNLVVIPATKYEQAELKEELAENWDLVADCIINGTWQAIYAESEEELAEILSEMTEEAVAHGYEDCMNFCAEEAKKRYLLEEGVRNE